MGKIYIIIVVDKYGSYSKISGQARSAINTPHPAQANTSAYPIAKLHLLPKAARAATNADMAIALIKQLVF